MPRPSAPPDPRWRRLPEERPKQILDAAVQVFGERGLAHARLDDIARRAGLSKGTIYLYFPNKEELFREVVRQTFVATIERQERGLASATATQALEEVMQAYWAYLRSPTFGAVHRLVMGELHNFPDLGRFFAKEVVSRGHRLIGAVLARGIESGEFQTPDPSVAARMMVSLFLTHAIWCSNRAVFPQVADRSDEQVFADIRQFFLHAISADQPAAAGRRSAT